MAQPLNFPSPNLPDELVQDLLRFNPWWQGKQGAVLPSTRRTLVAMMQRRLTQRLAPVVVVRGPRQIGKTTAQLHLIQDLLISGVKRRFFFLMKFKISPMR